MALLRFLLGDRPPLMQPLRPGRIVVGRSDTSDIALPSESVSRIHCVLDRRTEGWCLSDRSRNGTRVNGSLVTQHMLAPGDLISIGAYTARFELTPDDTLRAPTKTTLVHDIAHEELIDAAPDAWTAARAGLRFVRGPLDGETVQLSRSRSTIGGTGAHVALDGLPFAAVHIRVVRGRALVEPGEAAAWLAGARVREITPVLPGEEVRVGDHGFTVEVTSVAVPSPERGSFGELVGTSVVLRRLFGVLERVAQSDAVVLLTGESGTGKELAARGLHDGGDRHEGPFVAINCAAVSEALFESELFGHEKGAFTGALQRRDGAFHQAAGGTLFLDEIGEMKPDLQAKLLRALESGEVRRVGGTGVEYPDVRLVTATNQDLPTAIRDGRFRADLYFRIAVVTLRMPPLREHPEDVAVIATTLLARAHPGAELTPGAALVLRNHDWPGNVREMRNVLTRAVVLGGKRIETEAITFDPWRFSDLPRREPRPSRPSPLPEDQERASLVAALTSTEGNRTRAARLLGIPRSSLLYKLQRYGLTGS